MKQIITAVMMLAVACVFTVSTVDAAQKKAKKSAKSAAMAACEKRCKEHLASELGGEGKTLKYCIKRHCATGKYKK
ncbi:MAG: hypothetical protein IIB62_12840 [Proteobacteria bacterium]|nr:hypothetical protein [Pseudomonadota bacterium]